MVMLPFLTRRQRRNQFMIFLSPVSQIALAVVTAKAKTRRARPQSSEARRARTSSDGCHQETRPDVLAGGFSSKGNEC